MVKKRTLAFNRLVAHIKKIPKDKNLRNALIVDYPLTSRGSQTCLSTLRGCTFEKQDEACSNITTPAIHPAIHPAIANPKPTQTHLSFRIFYPTCRMRLEPLTPFALISDPCPVPMCQFTQLAIYPASYSPIFP